jgi:feruloyl esterase
MALAHTIALLTLGAAPLLGAPLGGQSCERLAALELPTTKIAISQAVEAGVFTPPGAVKPVAGLPAFCRVAGSIQPSKDSDIQFEVWMPIGGWNGKFRGIGNGGFAGSIDYGGLERALRDGYATAATDTGHSASGIDAGWALGHPEKIVDFGYRAIHETAEKAKAIIRSYYDHSASHSYFDSCSNGGRQALMEAERYPADYDGIVAGAPANYWTFLTAGFLWNSQALAAPGGFIAPAKLPAIQNAVLLACDAQDGVKDGVVDDPTKCHVDTAALLCKGPETDQCLTQAEISTLQKIYSGPHTSTGASIFPGFSPGGETGAAGWGLWVTGVVPGASLQFLFSTHFMQDMVANDPAWDLKAFNFDTDVKKVEDKMGPILNATSTGLKAFQGRGGKLILYHGWSDAAIPPVSTINYFHAVGAAMGASNEASFIRLYMVPGMQHCGGGPGPSSFVMESAVEKWVESGTAPNEILARKYANPSDYNTGVVRTRPLCPYPQTAHYTGKGSTDDAANFRCQ